MSSIKSVQLLIGIVVMVIALTLRIKYDRYVRYGRKKSPGALHIIVWIAAVAGISAALFFAPIPEQYRVYAYGAVVVIVSVAMREFLRR